MTYRVRLLKWGIKGYKTAWEWQERAATEVRLGNSEALAFVEHSPVYTFGRRVRPEHLLIASDELSRRGADLVESDRGGDITFHGPGQIVCYPILDLKRRGIGPSEYVRCLEESLIRTLAGFDIAGERSTGRPGVWVGGNKIAAIGVRLRGGITTHGLALNVNTDLSWFDAIVPCGITGAGVTSMAKEFGAGHVPQAEVEDALAQAFEGVFDSELIRTDAIRWSSGRGSLRATGRGLSRRELAGAHGH